MFPLPPLSQDFKFNNQTEDLLHLLTFPIPLLWQHLKDAQSDRGLVLSTGFSSQFSFTRPSRFKVRQKSYFTCWHFVSIYLNKVFKFHSRTDVLLHPLTFPLPPFSQGLQVLQPDRGLTLPAGVAFPLLWQCVQVAQPGGSLFLPTDVSCPLNTPSVIHGRRSCFTYSHVLSPHKAERFHSQTDVLLQLLMLPFPLHSQGL